MAKKKAAKKAVKRTTKKAIVTAVPKEEKFNFDAIFARIAKERADSEERAKAQLRAIAEELFLLGVKQAIIEYNGEGDSGDIEGVFYEKVGENKVPDYIETKLRDVVWSLLPSGFENNDGGFGTVIIDCAGNKVTAEHNQRIIEVESSSKEFDL